MSNRDITIEELIERQTGQANLFKFQKGDMITLNMLLDDGHVYIVTVAIGDIIKTNVNPKEQT